MAELGVPAPGGPHRPGALLERIEHTLEGTRPRHALDECLVPGLTLAQSRELRRFFPAEPLPAAVLIALVAHPDEPTVLLTQRSRGLRHHAGQVSFPGGQVEAGDHGPLEAALREAREEIGLDAGFVSVIGYLPDHLVISGFRVTPVVARVTPGFALRGVPEEVEDIFEVPLSFVFDPDNHLSRRHRMRGGEVEVQMTDIPYGQHRIWGATAGMLMTLYRMCFPESGDV